MCQTLHLRRQRKRATTVSITAVLWLAGTSTRQAHAQHLANRPADSRNIAASQSTPSVEPLPNPDLSGMEDVVLEQLRDARAALISLAQKPGVSATQLGRAYGHLGMLYQAYNLQQPAEACYLNASVLEPGELKWHYGLGYLYQAAGNFRKAADAFERAMQIQPSEVVLLRSAEVSLALGRLQPATVLFHRV